MNTIEYSMSEAMAKELLKSRKGDELKMHPQDYLCFYVDTELGIKGKCTKVVF